MDRRAVLERIEKNNSFDVIVIGGGATGIGTALESALRGYKVLLVEKTDFSRGTSSRSTKLIHGGVRYLAQGDIFLVMEALRERGFLLKNAPHLVRDQGFIIPNYRWWEGPFYTIGLKLYDLMSGRLSMGSSIHLSLKRTRELLPGIKEGNLKGGILYQDGQFDDSRLAMDLLHSLFEEGGMAVNYFPATAIHKDKEGIINGIQAVDRLSGKEYRINASIVVNATGVWVDEVIKMDHPEARPIVRPSQGIHLVLDKKFLPGRYALMIPKTDDGRVLFAVPWHDHLILGTTDTPIDHASEEPEALNEEVDFILRTAGRYLRMSPSRKDVLSVFAGLRPLAAPKDEDSRTREISRSHKIVVSGGRLITVTGGKWTTYRKMAEDTINRAESVAGIKRTKSRSRNYKIAGNSSFYPERDTLSVYGPGRDEILKLVEKESLLGEKIHPDLSYIMAEVIWLCRNEMVLKLEDLMARRLRALFLNARASMQVAPYVSRIVARELNWDEDKRKEELDSFLKLAGRYIL